MATSIDDRSRELLQAPNFAHVATLSGDGSAHGVIVWLDLDGDRVVLNTAQGRRWERNVERDPRITLTVPNGENPYEFVSVRGRVTEVTPDGADEHIDALAKKYLGQDSYPYRQEGEVRVRVVVEPDSVKLRAA